MRAGHDRSLGHDAEGIGDWTASAILKPNAQGYARMFQGDLELFEEHLWHEDLFEVWKGDWRAMFEAGDTAN